MATTYLALQQIQQSELVRSKLDQVADRIAARAKSITDRDRRSKELDVVTRTRGTRPRGRAYSQVGIIDRTRKQAEDVLTQANQGGTVPLTAQALSGAQSAAQ